MVSRKWQDAPAPHPQFKEDGRQAQLSHDHTSKYETAVDTKLMGCYVILRIYDGAFNLIQKVKDDFYKEWLLEVNYSTGEGRMLPAEETATLHGMVAGGGTTS